VSALSVSLGDIEVGVLEHFDDESEAFTFSKSYLSAHIDHRPVLGQIFEDRFPRSIDNGGPFGWFDHLLPQGVMRRWRARLNTLDVDDGFGLLTLLGDNLPGAVVLRPTESTFKKSQKAIQNLALQPADPQFRFSLAGAQWKLSANLQGRGLTTNAQTSGIEYIAKFHSPEYPELPNCEFATMSWQRHPVFYFQILSCDRQRTLIRFQATCP
jgi:serine/threonine-protein kinase HipA